MRGVQQLFRGILSCQGSRLLGKANMKEMSMLYRPQYSFFGKTSKHEKNEEHKKQDESETQQQQKTQEKPQEKEQEKAQEKAQEKPQQEQKQQSNQNNGEKQLQEQINQLNQKLKDNERLFNVLDKTNVDQSKKINDLRENLKAKIEEMDLTRARFEKEKEQLKVFGITNFAKDLLEVQDNLERAIESNKVKKDDVEALLEGVLLTQQILEKTLKKFGVVKISPMGEKFNPNFQESLFQVEDKEKEPGVVCYVAQDGYMIGERVLRPAKVGVVKD